MGRARETPGEDRRYFRPVLKIRLQDGVTIKAEFTSRVSGSQLFLIAYEQYYREGVPCKEVIHRLEQKYGNIFRFRIKPGETGIDVTVRRLADVRRVGFKYAEIKPMTISGANTFTEQVANWNLRNAWGKPYKVRAITYDALGNILDGF